MHKNYSKDTSGVSPQKIKFPIIGKNLWRALLLLVVGIFINSVSISVLLADTINISISLVNSDGPYIHFGTVPVGQIKKQRIRIDNMSNSTGNATGNLTGLSSPFSLSETAFNVPPGEDKTINVSFSPNSPEEFSQTLKITHNGTNPDSPSPLNIPVTGEGEISSCILSITINPSASGNVVKNPDKSSYNYGETVQLRANPVANYRFDHWGGNLSGNTNPTSITMNGNKSVTAYFVLTSHTVSQPNTPSGPSSGKVGQILSFSTEGSICNQGHSVQYRFDWGDGNYSPWSSSSTASYSWLNGGIYSVKAQSR